MQNYLKQIVISSQIMNYMTQFYFDGEVILEEEGIINIPKETVIDITSKKYRIFGFGMLTDKGIFIIYLVPAE